MSDNKEKQFEIAFNAFESVVNQCSNHEEISLVCQCLIGAAAKVLNGIEGKEFKDGFLIGAIQDDEAFVPKKALVN